MSEQGGGLLSGSVKKQAFESTIEALQAFHYPHDAGEKRNARRYLNKRVRLKRKRAKLIEQAKRKLGKYSPALQEATELWPVNDALAALRDQYHLTINSEDRKIYLRALRYIERLKKCH